MLLVELKSRYSRTSLSSKVTSPALLLQASSSQVDHSRLRVFHLPGDLSTCHIEDDLRKSINTIRAQLTAKTISVLRYGMDVAYKITTFWEEATSTLDRSSFWSNWNCWNEQTQRKIPGAMREPATNATHIWAGIEPRPHWWEAKALTTALCLLPYSHAAQTFLQWLTYILRVFP